MGCGCGKNNDGKRVTPKTITKEQADAITQAAGKRSGSRKYEKLKQLLDSGDIEGYKKTAALYDKRDKKRLEQAMRELKAREQK